MHGVKKPTHEVLQEEVKKKKEWPRASAKSIDIHLSGVGFYMFLSASFTLMFVQRMRHDMSRALLRIFFNFPFVHHSLPYVGAFLFAERFWEGWRS